MRRSPSPPTSASTLSSSFNSGGNGNTTTPLLQDTSQVGPEPDTTAARSSSKDEWTCELQSIPRGGLEAVTGSGSERCGWLGLEDWETMLSETAASSGQDQSLLRWISGDVDDASFGLKQLLQSGNNSNSLEFDGNAGLGMVDQGSNFDHIGSSVFSPNLGFSCGSSFNGKMGFVPSSSGLLNYKVSNVGLMSNNGGNNNNSNFSNSALPVSLPHGMVYQNHQQFENPDEKPQILNPQVFMNQHQSQLPHQNPNFFMPVTSAQQE